MARHSRQRCLRDPQGGALPRRRVQALSPATIVSMPDLRLRQLGRSGLQVSPHLPRRQRVRLDRRRADVVPPPRRLGRRRHELRRHRRRLLALGAGPRRRRIGNDHRQVAEAERQARPRRPRDQGRQAHGRRRQGLVEGLHPARRRGVAAPPARPTTSTSTSRTTTTPATPLEETLDGVRRSDQAKARCARSARRTTPASASRSRSRRAERARPAALRVAAAALQPGRARAVRRASSSRCAVEHGVGVINFYALRERLPDRQVPQQGRPRQERARQRRRQVPRTSAAWRSSARSTRSPATVGATPAQVALAWQIARPASPRRSPARPARRSSPSLVDAAALTPRHAVDRD